jgi:hypothetical protein
VARDRTQEVARTWEAEGGDTSDPEAEEASGERHRAEHWPEKGCIRGRMTTQGWRIKVGSFPSDAVSVLLIGHAPSEDVIHSGASG